jgi:glycerol-3-phosphate dehydrogenase
LFIAGGGINGAALARLAAGQGISTALAEAADFGSGASSNTSKLIHGGLRYLETGDFALVSDAVHERARLLALAPHLVQQQRFLFPLCHFGRHGRWAVKAGMTLYDALSGSMRLQPHGYIPSETLHDLEPAFLPGEAASAYAYSDCIMDDARLTLETVLDAQALGAQVWNYHRVVAIEPAGSAWEVTVEDRITGKEKAFVARRVALALGPWTDLSVKQFLDESKIRVRLSQGSHLLVQGIKANSCFLLPVPESRRYFFVIPFRGLHLVGTTEVEVSGHAGSEFSITPGEKEELGAWCAGIFRTQLRVSLPPSPACGPWPWVAEAPSP